MADNTAPVLLGLSLPANIDLSKDAMVLVRAEASDAGGAGVADVSVYLDREFNYVTSAAKLGFGRAQSSSVSIHGARTSDGFSDDTPNTASDYLSMSRANPPGTYRVLKVVVTDWVGNRTVYGAAELQAMGIATAIEVTGGIVDKAAPVLLDLSLPASVDVSRTPGPLDLVVKVQDNAGGTGVDRVLVRFEGETGLGMHTIVRPEGMQDGLPNALPDDGRPVSLTNPSVYLNDRTLSGIARIADLTVVDLAGNERVYTRAQLDAMGVNTSMTVVNGASKTAAVVQALEQGAVEIGVSSTAWAATGANSFKLVLAYNAEAADFDRAVLAAAPGLAVTTVSENGMERITVTGSGISAADALAGIRLTLRPVEGMLGNWWIQEFTVNGQEQHFGVGVPGGGFMQGGAGSELADLRAIPDGIVVSKSASGFQAVAASGYATLLADVEAVILGADRVALDTGGTAAQLYRLYQAAVDRAPDAVGLGYWIDRVERGVSLQEVAGAFMASAEFGTLYGASLSDDAFVAALYDNVLQRAPDAAGLAWWRDAFADGLTREEALVYFSDSAENLAQVAPAIADGITYTFW